MTICWTSNFSYLQLITSRHVILLEMFYCAECVHCKHGHVRLLWGHLAKVCSFCISLLFNGTFGKFLSAKGRAGMNELGKPQLALQDLLNNSSWGWSSNKVNIWSCNMVTSCGRANIVSLTLKWSAVGGGGLNTLIHFIQLLSYCTMWFTWRNRVGGGRSSHRASKL